MEYRNVSQPFLVAALFSVRYELGCSVQLVAAQKSPALEMFFFVTKSRDFFHLIRFLRINLTAEDSFELVGGRVRKPQAFLNQVKFQTTHMLFLLQKTVTLFDKSRSHH